MDITDTSLKRKASPDSDKNEGQPPEKKANQSLMDRNVYESDDVNNENSDSQTKKISSKKRQHSKQRLIVISKEIIENAKIWPFLSIRGLETHFFTMLDSIVIKNRPFCELIREILQNIHEREKKHRNKIAYYSTYINSGVLEKPKLSLVMRILEEMCDNVFSFQIDGISIKLYRSKMISALRKIFSQQRLQLYHISDQNILESLSSFCSARNVEVTEEELREAMTTFCDYSCILSVDLMKFIFTTKMNKSTGMVQIEAFRKPDIHLIQDKESGLVESEQPAVPLVSSINSTAGTPEETQVFTAVNVPPLPVEFDFRVPPPFFVPPPVQHNPIRFATSQPTPQFDFKPLTPQQDEDPLITTFPNESTIQAAPNDNGPSTVDDETPWNINEETDIPKKWVDAYKIMLEWNQDLKAEFAEAKTTLTLLL